MVNLTVDQFVTAVYNLTWGNRKLEPGFYYQADGMLYIRSSYFELLPGNGTYQFKVVGSEMTFNINVEVNITPSQLDIYDVEVEVGMNVIVYVGTTQITSVKVNGEVLDNSKYTVSDYTLHINNECFKEGDNEVLVNDSVSFKVTVKNLDEVIIDKKTEPSKVNVPLIIGVSVGSSLLVFAGVFVAVVLIKRRKAI